MADAIHGNTELTANKMDFIASIVQRELKERTNLLPLVTDLSSLAGKGVQSLSIPKLGSFTVTNRPTATQGDATLIVSSNDKLDLDERAYISYIVDSADSIQVTIDYEAELARRAGSAHGRYVDEKIIAELEVVGQAIAGIGAVDRDNFLEMRTLIERNNADMGQVVFTCGPVDYEALLKQAQFESAEVYGNPTIPSGIIPQLYGIPVIVNNQIASGSYYMFEKAGMAIAFQQRPSVSEQKANEFGSGAMRVAVDQLFGIKGMEIGEGLAAVAESALVIKDGNV